MSRRNGKKILLLSLFLDGALPGFANFTVGWDSVQNFSKVAPPHHIIPSLSTNIFCKIEKKLDRESYRSDAITCSTYRIERQAFKSNTASQIAIPEGITFIDQYAFADCPNLRSVSFPSTLQDIENAFIDCPLLESADLSSTSQLQSLVGSFKGCASLTTVTLPQNLKEIGKGTFEGCANLSSFPEIPSVKFIGDSAFKGTGLTRTPLLSHVDSVASNAFDTGKPILWDFGDVAWVDDPVQSDEDLFETYPEATGIRSFDQLSLNPTTLSLTEKTLAQFPWKESVQILSLPQEFQSLESLKGLVNLQDLEIPDGYRLSSVSSSLCSDCPKLKMPAFIPSIETDGIFHTIPTEDKSIQSALVLYGVQALSPGTFQNCKNLTKVRLADSLQVIGEKAFFGCAFDRIDLPKSLQLLGDKVCSGFSYEDLVLPDSLESIGTETFSNCSDLQLVIFPSSLQSIGEKAFSGCTKLSQLYGPHQISQLNENVFENCQELGVIQIFSYDDQKVMAGPLKDNLQTALVLQGAESIGSSAFNYCFSLASIILPDSLRSVEDYAFQYCSSLASIILPNSVQSIGEGAFSDCSSLTSITLPASLQSIGEEAFYDCVSLASIILPDSLQSIGNSAFSYCASLVEIDVSKITLEVTNSISWTYVFYNSTDRTRVTKVICRREQADKMKSVFTNATLTYVD